MGLNPGSPGSGPGLKEALNCWATRAALDFLFFFCFSCTTWSYRCQLGPWFHCLLGTEMEWYKMVLPLLKKKTFKKKKKKEDLSTHIVLFLHLIYSKMIVDKQNMLLMSCFSPGGWLVKEFIIKRSACHLWGKSIPNWWLAKVMAIWHSWHS